MVRIEKVDTQVEIKVVGLHKLWAFTSRLVVPMEHIVSVRPYDPHTDGGWKGIRVLGTSFPFLIHAGRFEKDGLPVFWDVSNYEKAIIISLRNEFYSKLILEVKSVEATLRKLGV